MWELTFWEDTLWKDEVAREPSLLAHSIDQSVNAFGHESLKPVQREAVELSGRDVFVSAPTGYGKCLVYQILLFCATKLLDSVQKSPSSVPDEVANSGT